MSWRRWSSDFLPVSSGGLAAVLCRRTRCTVGHLEQTAVDQPFYVLPDETLLHAVETFAGEGKEQKFAVGLLGVGFLRIFVHDDPTVKNAVCVAIEDPVVELPAAAARAGMFYQHVVVQVLVAVADEEAVNQTLSPFACQHGVYVVAHQRTAQ